MIPISPSNLQSILNQVNSMPDDNQDVGMTKDGRVVTGTELNRTRKKRMTEVLKKIGKDQNIETNYGFLQKRGISAIKANEVKRILTPSLSHHQPTVDDPSLIPDKARSRLMDESDRRVEARKAKDRFELDTLSTSENPRTKVIEKFDQLVSVKDWQTISRLLSRITDIETLNFLQEHYSNVPFPNDIFLEYIDDQIQVVTARTTPLTKETTEFHGKVLFEQMKKDCQTLHQNAGDKVPHKKVTGACRYKDVIPPEATAIKDPSTTDQFYHANRVGDKHIAAQGPLPTPRSIAAQWNMLYETKASALVNLTNDDDRAKKSDPTKDDLAVTYWPAKGEMEEHNGLKVRTLEVEPDEESNSDLSVFTVELSKESEPPHRIKVFHYTGWPDHKIPTNRQNFRHFMQQLRKVDGVKAVHCKAGMGRTGTVTELDLLMDKIQSNPTIKPENLVETTQKLVMSGREDRGKAFVQESSQMSLLLEEGLLAIDERDNAYATVKKPRKKSTGTDSPIQLDSENVYQNYTPTETESEYMNLPKFQSSESISSTDTVDRSPKPPIPKKPKRPRTHSTSSTVSANSSSFGDKTTVNVETDSAYGSKTSLESFYPETYKIEISESDRKESNDLWSQLSEMHRDFEKNSPQKQTDELTALWPQLFQLPTPVLEDLVMAEDTSLTKHEFPGSFGGKIINYVHNAYSCKVVDDIADQFGLDQVTAEDLKKMPCFKGSEYRTKAAIKRLNEIR